MRKICALLVALLCAGCASPAPAGTPSAQGEATAPTPPPAPTATPAATGTPPPTGPPVATREATTNGIRLALDLYPIRRDGTSAVLTARLRVLERPADEYANADSVLAGSGFADGIQGRTNGFSLVDGPRKVVLHPATAAGQELCQPTFHGGWQRGDVYWVNCLFGAPHPATSQVTVRAVTFGSFSRVPVQ